MKKISISMLKSLWLFAIVIVTMIAGGLPVWVLSIFVVVALALPLIREHRHKTDLDERQIHISYFSSHIAYYVFLSLILLVMIREFFSQHKEPDTQWYMVLLVPLVIKLFISLFQNYGAVTMARWIGFIFSAIWILFVAFSHGFSPGALIEAAPFLLIGILAWFAKKVPLIAGIALLLLAIGMTFRFYPAWVAKNFYLVILMLSLIPLPVTLSGAALVWHSLYERKQFQQAG